MDPDLKILSYIGMNSYEELFSDIPKGIRCNIDSIGKGKSEMEVILNSEEVGSKNALNMKIFLGLGAYERYIPASIQNIIMRNEFITSYTPYQAEISQGMLQALFEYQSIISDLTGMEVTNSSMYDGPSGLGEAVRMAHRINGNKTILLPQNIRINHLQVIVTYITGLNMKLKFYPTLEDGTIDLEKLTEMVDSEVSSIITYNPSNYGTIDPGVTRIREIKKNALHIAYYDPISLALIKSPGDYDADIAVGEGQQLGISLSYGGPYLGLFSFKEKYVRKSPGRLIGETVDRKGKKAFVMTLQTREQHIRRDKAMSNICTNQALLAIASTAYLSILGNKGLKWVATKSMENVSKTISEMKKVSYVKPYNFKNPFFTDFIVDVGSRSQFMMQHLEEKNILGGFRAEDALYSVDSSKKNAVFFASTEMRNQNEMEYLKNAMEVME
ncbi:MAG: aminomethyl-transferring glycine dehydrogenase subunit GcvPA [Cuniculiplasma sp.]